MVYMPLRNDISPTLKDIVNQFDEDNQRPSDTKSLAQVLELCHELEDNNLELDDNLFDDCGPLSFDHDDHTNVIHDSSISPNPNSASHQEVYDYVLQTMYVNKCHVINKIFAVDAGKW